MRDDLTQNPEFQGIWASRAIRAQYSCRSQLYFTCCSQMTLWKETVGNMQGLTNDWAEVSSASELMSLFCVAANSSFRLWQLCCNSVSSVLILLELTSMVARSPLNDVSNSDACRLADVSVLMWKIRRQQIYTRVHRLAGLMSSIQLCPLCFRTIERIHVLSNLYYNSNFNSNPVPDLASDSDADQLQSPASGLN